MRIAIVWMPMVAGDDRAAALRAAFELASERVGHFWDESRRIGRSASVQFAASRLADLRRAAHEVPGLAARLDAWAAAPEAAPAWDCAFFYAAETAWTEPLPEPLAWTKQLGFWESVDGVESEGTFRTDRSPTTLEQSSWDAEIDLGMDRLLPQTAPRIELLGFSGCPHTAAVLANVTEAVRTLGLDARIAYVDQEALPRRRGRARHRVAAYATACRTRSHPSHHGSLHWSEEPEAYSRVTTTILRAFASATRLGLWRSSGAATRPYLATCRDVSSGTRFRLPSRAGSQLWKPGASVHLGHQSKERPCAS